MKKYAVKIIVGLFCCCLVVFIFKVCLDCLSNQVFPPENIFSVEEEVGNLRSNIDVLDNRLSEIEGVIKTNELGLSSDDVDIIVAEHLQDYYKQVKNWMNEHLDHIRYDITMDAIVEDAVKLLIDEKLAEFEKKVQKMIEDSKKENDKIDNALIQVSQQVTTYFENHIKDSIISPEMKNAQMELQISNETFRADMERELRRAFHMALGDLAQSITNEINSAKELEAEKKVQYELKIAVDEIKRGVVHSCSETVYDILDAYTRRNRESIKQLTDSVRQSNKTEKRLADLEAKVKSLSESKAKEK